MFRPEAGALKPELSYIAETGYATPDGEAIEADPVRECRIIYAEK